MQVGCPQVSNEILSINDALTRKNAEVDTCRAESPGGTQAYSSRAQPLSSSDAADGQLCAAWTPDDPPPAAVDGDLGDR